MIYLGNTPDYICWPKYEGCMYKPYKYWEKTTQDTKKEIYLYGTGQPILLKVI